MAEAKYWPAAKEALKAALASFLFPFFFIYSPAILLQFESFSSGMQQFLAVLLSFFTVSLALNKYWSTKLNFTQHALLISAALTSFISIFVVKSYLFLFLAGGLTIAGIALNMRLAKKDIVA